MKTKRSKWNFSILHNGEQGVRNLYIIFTIICIISIPIIHQLFHYPVLACIIISFVIFWSIPTIISIVLASTGNLSER